MPSLSVGPLHEWMAIVLVGCLGGLIATTFPKGTDVAFDPIVSDVVGTDKRMNLFAHAVLNVIAGGMASFILWSGYTSSVNFESVKLSPVELGAALSTGLGGVSIVRNLIAKAQASTTWTNAAKDSADAVEELAGTLEKDMDKDRKAVDNETPKEDDQ
jgi:hypothetical protein